MTSDDELIAAIRVNGDRTALDELVRRHLPQVRQTVFQMVLHDGDADDVTQEVFLRAIRGLNGFNRRAKFSTWLVRIAMNTAYTHLERRSRAPVESLATSTDQAVATSAAPEARLLMGELTADVERALAELSISLRAAVVLTSFQGMSPAEAAQVENCSTATMYWRIHEARKKLRTRLKEHLT